MRGTVEPHVLDEMREPTLVVVFQNRPGPDDKPQLEPVLGIAVVPDPEPEPIGEPAEMDRGVGLERGR